MVISKITFDHQDYEKIVRIGVGAFGSVYKCRNKATGQVVAVKILNLEEYDDNIADVQQEILILRKACESPHVVGVYGSFVAETDLWIVMEYMSGGSILDLMKPGPLDEKYVAVILREMLLGLDHLHKMDIIHRDIKAANVLMSHEGQIKLADFGVCGQLSATLTKRTSLVGTVFWMAPEVIQQQSGYNTSVDIWSLGITAIEMAKGVPPYYGDDPFKIMFMIPRNEAPTLEGSFSKAFKDFIALCLHKDPSKRPSAQDLLKHKFIKSAKKGTTILTELIDRIEVYKSTHNKNPTSLQSRDDPSVESTNSTDDNDSEDDENIKWVWKKESMKTLNKDKNAIETLRKTFSAKENIDSSIEDDVSSDDVPSDIESETSENTTHGTITKLPQHMETSNSETSSESNSSVHHDNDDSSSTSSIDSVTSENAELEKLDNIVIDHGLSGMPSLTENFIEDDDDTPTTWDFPKKSSPNAESVETLQLVILPAIAKASEMHKSIPSTSIHEKESIVQLKKIFQNLENELPGFSLSFYQSIHGSDSETKPEMIDQQTQFISTEIEDAFRAKKELSEATTTSDNKEAILTTPLASQKLTFEISNSERELQKSLGSLFMARWKEKNFAV